MRAPLLCLAISLLPRAARADDAPVPAATPTAATPTTDDATFTTLDRADGVSRAGVETSFVFLDDYGDGVKRSAQRYDVHAQSVNAQLGIGAYATIPINVFRYQGYSAEGALGNIELGALYVRPLQPGLTLIAHVGGVLPSSDNPNDNGDGRGTPNALGQPSRLTDALLGQTRVVAIRAAGALRYRRDQLVARVDLGLDQSIAQFDSLNSSTDVRVAVAAGWDFGVAMPAIELTTLLNAPHSTRAAYAAAVSLRARAARLQPFAALVIPLDNLAFNTAITLGLDVLLP